jgi:hypothetical protein
MPKFQPKGSTKEDLESAPIVEVKSKTHPPKTTLIQNEEITAKFEIEDLPSEFKPYKTNTRIFARSYSYREVKLLSDSRLPLDKQYEIISKGIEVEGIQVLDLTLFDFIYINVLRKLASLGVQSYRIPYICPKCGEDNFYEFGLDDIGFDVLEVPELPVVVDFYTIGKLSFMPITVGNFINLIRENKLYVTDANGELILDVEGKKIKDSIAIMASQCIDLDYEKAYSVFSELTSIEDQKLLEDVDTIIDHGIKALTFNCETIEENEPKEHPSTLKTCNNEISVGLTGGESIIIPFREHREIVKTRISYGS